MATKTFFFNNGDSYTGGLSMTFTRGVPTCDYEGNPITGDDDERYDRTVTIASASANPTDVLTCRSASLLGSGLNAAGTDYLWVVSELRLVSGVETKYVHVLNTAAPATNGNTFTNSTQYATTAPTPLAGGEHDILKGAITNKGYSPIDAIVCWGSIWLVCKAFTRANSSSPWIESGIGLVRSDDAGKTWSWYWDDLDIAYASDRRRGQRWSVQNYYTPGYRGTGPLLEAWLVVSDYLNVAPGGAGGARESLCSASAGPILPPTGRPTLRTASSPTRRCGSPKWTSAASPWVA